MKSSQCFHFPKRHPLSLAVVTDRDYDLRQKEERPFQMASIHDLNLTKFDQLVHLIHRLLV